MILKVRIPTPKGFKFSKYSGVERALKDGKEAEFDVSVGGVRIVRIFTPENLDEFVALPGYSSTDLTSAIEDASNIYLKRYHTLFFGRWEWMSRLKRIKRIANYFTRSREPNLTFENDSDEWIMRGHKINIKREGRNLLLVYTWRLNNIYDSEQGKWRPQRYHESLATIKTRDLEHGLNQFRIKGIDDSKAPFRRDLPAYYLSGNLLSKFFPNTYEGPEEIPPSPN